MATVELDRLGPGNRRAGPARAGVAPHSVAKRTAFGGATWPKLAAVAIGFGTLAADRVDRLETDLPFYPGPGKPVFHHLWLGPPTRWLSGTATTLRRAVEYYVVAFGRRATLHRHRHPHALGSVRTAVSPLVTGFADHARRWRGGADSHPPFRHQARGHPVRDFGGQHPRGHIVGTVAAIDARTTGPLASPGEMLGGPGGRPVNRHVVLPAASAGLRGWDEASRGRSRGVRSWPAS